MIARPNFNGGDVGFSGSTSVNPDGSFTADPMAQVSFDTPAVGTYSPQSGYTAPVGTQYSPMPTNPQQGGGGGGGGMSQPGTVTAPFTPQQPAAPIHHYADYMQGGSQFGQAIGDQTYVNQKAALVNKLNDYERNIAGQVGDQNMSLNHASDPNDLLGDYWSMKSLGGDLYDKTQDANGNFNYADNHKLGGSMDKNFSVGIDNFNNQQQHGLRGVAEDFAARGMLGSGSGVWQTARNNLQDQYNNQLTNMNDSTISQYNNLLAGLGDQYNQARPALTGYLGDAANRLSSASAAGLPTNV